MSNQQKFNYISNESKTIDDQFTKNTKPLKDLLDSVRDVEGFPLGKDEDILALSDPPYYSACPNPYINDFISTFGKPYDPVTDKYERTPFVGDVSEGKNDPIYNAHSYHTKVPHKAIMKYIEHYTNEGDIVFDGFSGSGMTGIAAQLLNRRSILSDLSPVATFIASNYNTPVDVNEFEIETRRILAEVEKECGWMYETIHTDGKTKAKINYTVWSDVFICPYCQNDYVFWEAAADKKRVLAEYECPHCKASTNKRDSKRATVTFYDNAIGQEVSQAKQVPVIINYSIEKMKFEKCPDEADLNIYKQIERNAIPHWFPTYRMPEGDESRRNDKIGITHVHHFYTKRNLWVIATLWEKTRKAKISTGHLFFTFEQVVLGMSKLARYAPTHYSQVNQMLSGTLYVGSQVVEVTPNYILNNKLKRLIKVFDNKSFPNCGSLISTQSTTKYSNSDNSVDYIFTDPPFGANLMYSELNFLWEAWHRVFTNNEQEAIVNKSQNKSLNEYKELMTSCFKEMYRILKPNRWITVEFHNSKASVWNAIQDSITKAGFIIAQVAVLDKKQSTFKQITSAGAVKNDLVINAYKPREDFENHFLKNSGENLEREFIAEHLSHLPVEPNIERTEQMLYSKMLAHYVQRGYIIRFNARQFYKLLKDNFKLIDRYWFDESDVLKYEQWKKKKGLESLEDIRTGQQIMFIKDEKSALIWIYHFLETPQTFGDVYTAFNKVVTTLDDAIPEVRELLDNNFILEGKMYRCPQTDKEMEDIQEQRERILKRAFEKVLVEARSGGKRLKNVRKEAVKYGFTLAYQEKRFTDILDVSKKLDRNILEENSELNDFVEIAQLKVEGV